jgi:hypothetical protein
MYLRENDPDTSIFLSSRDALKVIRTAMNDMSPRPFLEDSGDETYSVEGVQAVRYIRGHLPAAQCPLQALS